MSDQAPSIEAIVFDLGGVLIDWNPRYLYRQLSKDTAKIEDFLQTICHSEWNSRLDAGVSFADLVAERIKEFPGYREWIEAYRTRWIDMIGGEISGTVTILEELARRESFRLLALTNWSAETLPFAKERFPLFRHFEGIVVSGDEKCIKPDPQIFHILLRRYGLESKHCLFIDDMDKNVAVAQDLGFHGIRFSSPQALREQLAKYSIVL